MAVTVVNNTGASGTAYSSDLVYATARSGGGMVLSFGGSFSVGQFFNTGDANYNCYEPMKNFDLFAFGIPANAVVSVVTLEEYCDYSNGGQAFDYLNAVNNWGDTLSGADYVPGGTVAGFTSIATLNSASFATLAYNTITEVGTGLKDAVVACLLTDGVLRLTGYSSRLAAGNSPNVIADDESAGFDGTTNKAKLTVTYTVPGGLFRNTGGSPDGLGGVGPKRFNPALDGV